MIIFIFYHKFWLSKKSIIFFFFECRTRRLGRKFPCRWKPLICGRDIEAWTQTHREIKNRAHYFIKNGANRYLIPIGSGYVSTGFRSLQSIATKSTVISISNSVSCHFFFSFFSFFFLEMKNPYQNCFLLPNCREARVSTFVCFKV